MKDCPAYPLVIAESRKLAENLKVPVPAELSQQFGSPAQRFDQVLFGVAVLFTQANDKLKGKKPKKPSRFATKTED